MSFLVLFRDELRGFYGSKVMMFLWIGLPLMAVLVYLWSPDTEPEMPLAAFSALLLSSIGGTLASVMLAVSIINEKDKKVYDLFMIRPIKRRNILLSKFFAVYLCLVIAGLIALGFGMLVDYFHMGGTPEVILENALESVVLTLSMMAIASGAGILIGVVSPSVLLGAIIVIYGGNQISIVPMLPNMLGLEHEIPFSILFSLVITGALLWLSVFIFDRKQF